MTVSELIAELQKMPQDVPVRVRSGENEGEADFVSVERYPATATFDGVRTEAYLYVCVSD